MEPTQLPAFPAEVLVHIFQNLPSADLRRCRLACSRWNAIILDSAVLTQKFEIFLSYGLLKRRGTLDWILQRKSLGGVTFGASCDPLQTPLEPFWERCGGTLEKLALTDCSLSAQAVLEVLRRTPNLKSFMIGESRDSSLAYYTPTWASFGLAKLEKLDLRLKDDRFLNLFGQLAGNLRVLKYDGKWMVAAQLFQTLLPLVKSRKDTLKKLTLREIQTSPELLDQIGLIKGLQLTAISLQRWECLTEEAIARFLRRQRNLEQFKCNVEYYMDPGMLLRLADTQPKLRCVQVGVRMGDVPLFLRKVPQLEHLNLSLGDSMIIDLGYNSNPNLKKVNLTGYNILKARMAPFLQRSQNIRHLTLEFCRQPNVNEFIDTIAELRSLEYLKILNHSSKLGKLISNDATKALWPRLTTLHLRSCELAPGTIPNLVHRSPNLEKVKIENITNLQDADVLAICQLSKLRRLTLNHPRDDLSEVALGYLKQYCRGLSRLEFSIDGKAIIEQCRDREFAKALPGVDVDMVPRLPNLGGMSWYDDFEEIRNA